MNKEMNEFAKLFVERNNKPHLGILIGKVISSFPNIIISLDEETLLNKENLVFSASLLENYERQFAISGDMQFNDANCGITNTGTVTSLSIDTTFTTSGTIKYTDSLVIGDEVIVMPTQNEQVFFVLQKAVRL